MTSFKIQTLRNVFRCSFPVTHPHFKDIKDLVKAIPGSKFKVYNEQKFWTVPIERKEDLQPIADTFEAYWIQGNSIEDDKRPVPDVEPLPELTLSIPVFSKKHGSGMYDFQSSGVARGLQLKRFINGDQPGLGKTVQAIATIEGGEVTEPGSTFPCLIICPATLKQNWKDEIEDWTDRGTLILDNNCKNNFQFYATTGVAQYFITNFESLKKYFIEKIDDPGKGKPLMLKHIHFKDTISIFKSVIIDEAHRLKDHTTQQAKFAKGICTGKEWIIELTGTPVINKPADLMSPLAMMERLNQFGNMDGFKKTFCAGPREASNLRLLNYQLNKLCFYRRTKDEVMKDLPLKSRQIVKVEITTRKEYIDAARDLENYLRQYKEATESQISRALRGEIMVKIGILKNISARGKILAACEWIRDLLATGEKLVLFAHLKEVVNAMKEHFPQAVTITGEDNEAQRDVAKKRFQNDPACQLIICSIKAAGVGITLTASSRVTFLELPWTYADTEQCEDRCHRIGQKDNVTCTYILGHDTIDEHIYKIIMNKKEIAHTVTGTEDKTEENVVSAMIDLFNNNKIKL